MDRNKRITKPKYEIIKEALLERIRTGQFSSDAVFCTEKMLSEQYEVSRITAKRAIEDLEQQGILYRKRGVGSFVSQKIPPVSSSASENDSKSKMVSLLLPFATTQGNISETIGSLSAALAEKGYFLSIHITGSSSPKERATLELLRSQNIAGLVYYPKRDNIHLEQLNDFLFANRPVVIIDNQTGETVTVKLGVVGGIYDDPWASAKAALADEGIDLEIVQFSDYVTPNNALANGDIDLNAFQHRIYLQSEIDNYGYAIQNIGNTFIIPLNLYSQKVSSVDELKDGDVVAIPDDLTNGGRALKVLEAAGLIELDPNAAFNPTVDDITSYKVNITIEELKANTIPSVLPDVAAAVVNGNYALDFGLKTDEAIYKDSVLDVEEYWNLIAARTADVEDPDTAAIYEKVVEAFQSSATEDVFNNTFGGYFIAVGWDQDLINQ